MPKSTAVHRYKWTLQEKLVLSIPSIAILFFLTKSSIEQGGFAFLWLLALVPWMACFALLVNIGASKKKNSRLIAEWDPETTETSVEGNKIYKAKTNKGVIRDADNAYVTKVGVNDTLVIAFEGEKSNLYIPMRLVSRKPFLEFMEKNVLEADNIKKTAEVKELFENAKKFNR